MTAGSCSLRRTRSASGGATTCCNTGSAARKTPFNEDEKWDDALVARHVLAKIDANTTVNDLIEKLPFSRFKIYRSRETSCEKDRRRACRGSSRPLEGFLLSRIDGRLTIRDILRITPMQELEALRAFKRLLAARVIDFPRRKVAAEAAPSPVPTR